MNSDVICADFSNEDNQNKVHYSFHYEKIKELLQEQVFVLTHLANQIC